MSDALKRAVHTFWQAALGSVVVVWAGSGLDAGDLTSMSGVAKAAVALGVGVVAAGLSAVYHQLTGDLKPPPRVGVDLDRVVPPGIQEESQG